MGMPHYYIRIVHSARHARRNLYIFVLISTQTKINCSKYAAPTTNQILMRLIKLYVDWPLIIARHSATTLRTYNSAEEVYCEYQKGYRERHIHVVNEPL